MITIKDCLDVGVEFAGSTHKEFELKPATMRDEIEAQADEKSANDNTYLVLSLLSRQLVRLGEIPKESITPQLLLDATSHDIKILIKAQGDLERKLSSFRSKRSRKESDAAEPGSDETRVDMGDSSQPA
jgi:hypothetical protein